MFALTFALGVVSGITMSFQFGTNWPGYMEKVGNIAGPLLGYEVLTAFFLEASFLGIMLFGHGKVSERVHLLATFLVAVRHHAVSAFWILALNSWMQTPAGYEIIDGEFHVDELAGRSIFNPSFPYRLHAHAAGLGADRAPSCSPACRAWQLLRGDGQRAAPRGAAHRPDARRRVLIPLQIFVGDLHGLNTLEHQPAKIAAMEGIWDTERGAPLLLFALPDDERRARNHFEIAHPEAGEPDPDARRRRRDQGPERVPRRAPAGGAGVLRASASWSAWAC